MSTSKVKNFELWDIEIWGLNRRLLKFKFSIFFKLKYALRLEKRSKVHGFNLSELCLTRTGRLYRFSWSLKKTKDTMISPIDVSRKTTFSKGDFFKLVYFSFSTQYYALSIINLQSMNFESWNLWFWFWLFSNTRTLYCA